MIDKDSAVLYKEREKRFTDAIELKIPDQVPVMIEMSYFPAKYAGITCEAAFYDYDLWLKATLKATVDYAPDVVQVIPFFPGAFYEILDSKQMKVPGHGADPNHSQQFIEGEFLKANEYDALMTDRTDYNLRYFLPRIFGSLEPFSKLPPFSSSTFSYYEVPALAEALVSPEIQGALEKLLKAGNEVAKWRSRMTAFGKEIEKAGFPLYATGVPHVPFDHISYQMRGMKGIYLDMYRQPEKLIEVFDWMLPLQIQKALANAKASGRKRVNFALHRGADNFMSAKQFEKFYWPYVKKLVGALVAQDLTPCLFIEGDYTSRLEYFLELPKGKVLGRFDSSDIIKTKKVLNDHMCIMGNVPASTLQTGTIKDVEDYCKMLIDVVGKDGGLIVCPRSTPDEVKPENLKAMVDFTRKYGVYK